MKKIMAQRMNSGRFVFSTWRLLVFSGVFCLIALITSVAMPLRFAIFGEGNLFRHTPGQLSVHTINVGHGDAIAIRFPCERVALIDSGEARYARRVRDYMRRRVTGRRGRIDWMILTHPHYDHMGGLPQLMRDFDVGVFFRPIIASTSTHDHDNAEVFPYTGAGGQPIELYTQIIYDAHRFADEVRVARAGAYFVGPVWRFFFHTPTPAYNHAVLNNHNKNEVSPIKTLEFGNQVFVFTGDAGHMAEGDFMTTDTAREIFWDEGRERVVHLSVGHHGSLGSTSTDFLRFLQPTTASISAGTRVFGDATLPNNTVVGRLRAHTGPNGTFITRDVGHIAIRTDGYTYRVFLGNSNPPELRWIPVVLIFGAGVVVFWDWKKKEGAR